MVGCFSVVVFLIRWYVFFLMFPRDRLSWPAILREGNLVTILWPAAGIFSSLVCVYTALKINSPGARLYSTSALWHHWQRTLPQSAAHSLTMHDDFIAQLFSGRRLLRHGRAGYFWSCGLESQSFVFQLQIERATVLLKHLVFSVTVFLFVAPVLSPRF